MPRRWLCSAVPLDVTGKGGQSPGWVLSRGVTSGRLFPTSTGQLYEPGGTKTSFSDSKSLGLAKENRKAFPTELLLPVKNFISP